MRKTLIVLVSASLCWGADPPFAITPEVQAALDRISPDSLKGNLSFIASDLLEGRDTPSRGLEIAGEYIAAQFRKAGLEPGGGADYFQNAKLMMQAPNPDGFVLTFSSGEQKVSIPSNQAGIHVSAELDLKDAPVYKLDLANAEGIGGLTAEELNGKVVLTELTRAAMQNGRAAMTKLRSAKPALVVMLERKAGESLAHVGPQLFDPEGRESGNTPRLSIGGDDASHFYDALKPGLSADAKADVHVAAPKDQPVQLRNVVGILRGSDPALRDTCVVLSAHYDHIGQKPPGEGDRIYNGANDDGSGTVSVIEIANALASLKERPKRSIVFVTFFGEEKGGFGSRYYARHPPIALQGTIADINLEQVGRTDSDDGPKIANASLTGFDYSNVPEVAKAAGDLTGIKVYKDEHKSDQYFAQSDNVFLAESGVPAHSLTVAFVYPDYHGVGDEWTKIDYANMAKVDRMVATAILMLADNTVTPQWNANNPKAQRYLKAWKQMHP